MANDQTKKLVNLAAKRAQQIGPTLPEAMERVAFLQGVLSSRARIGAGEFIDILGYTLQEARLGNPGAVADLEGMQNLLRQVQEADVAELKRQAESGIAIARGLPQQ